MTSGNRFAPSGLRHVFDAARIRVTTRRLAAFYDSALVRTVA